MPTGFVERIKGKAILSAASLGIFGVGGATFRGGGNIYVNSGAGAGGVGGNGADTTEDTLDTFTLPANSLDIPGRMLNIYAFGTYAANGNNKTVKLYFGAALQSTGVQTQSGGAWALELLVMKVGSNVQVVNGQVIIGAAHGGTTYTAGSETDTAGIVIKVTGQSGTATANNIVLNGWFISAMN